MHRWAWKMCQKLLFSALFHIKASTVDIYIQRTRNWVTGASSLEQALSSDTNMSGLISHTHVLCLNKDQLILLALEQWAFLIWKYAYNFAVFLVAQYSMVICLAIFQCLVGYNRLLFRRSNSNYNGSRIDSFGL